MSESLKKTSTFSSSHPKAVTESRATAQRQKIERQRTQQIWRNTRLRQWIVAIRKAPWQ